MPADIREALHDAAPRQVPVLDFETLWRRHRRAGMLRVTSGVAVAVAATAATALGAVTLLDDDASPMPADNAPQPVDLPGDPDDWDRVELSGTDRIEAITPGGPGLVAVGTDTGGAGSIAAWTSVDGTQWTRVEAVDGTGALLDVARAGPGLVAVGQRSAADGASAQIWTSTDGLDWNQLPDDPVFDSAWLDVITPGGPGVVAVGTVPEGAQAWYSADGVSWHRAEVPAAPDNIRTGVFDSAPQRAAAFMDDLAVVSNRLVAIGRVIVDDPTALGGDRYEQLMWTSTDGVMWTEVPLDPAAFPAESSISSLAQGPGGMVALGWHVERPNRRTPWEEGQEAAAWTSVDGRLWERAPAGQDAFTAITDGFLFEAGLTSVAASSAGYVAVGDDAPCPEPPCNSSERHIAVVLTSVDGRTWARIPTAPVFVGTGWSDVRFVTAWGSRFVATGEYDEQPAVWISK